MLRLVDVDLKPVIGYVYEAMNRTIDQIQNNFGNMEDRYESLAYHR